MNVPSYDLSPGSSVPFHLFLLPETNKEQRIYEKQHLGILLLKIPWQTTTTIFMDMYDSLILLYAYMFVFINLGIFWNFV